MDQPTTKSPPVNQREIDEQEYLFYKRQVGEELTSSLYKIVDPLPNKE